MSLQKGLFSDHFVLLSKLRKPNFEPASEKEPKKRKQKKQGNLKTPGKNAKKREKTRTPSRRLLVMSLLWDATDAGDEVGGWFDHPGAATGNVWLEHGEVQRRSGWGNEGSGGFGVGEGVFF